MKELNEFKTSLKIRGKTVATLNNVDQFLGEFITILNIQSIDEVRSLKREDIEKYLGVLDEKNKDNTKRTKLNYIKMFMKYLYNREILNDTRFIDGIEFSVEKKDFQGISYNDGLRMLKAMKRNPDLQMQFKTLLFSGIRVSELVSLEVENVLDDALRVYGKGKKKRIVKVPVELISELRSYINKTRNRLDTISEDEFNQKRESYHYRFYKDYNSYKESIEQCKSKNLVFVTVGGDIIKTSNLNAKLKRVANRLGIDESLVSCHKSRHAYATGLLEKNVPINIISKQLGHEQIATTQIYAATLDKSVESAMANINMMEECK